jgi:hypothetical protein
MFGWFNKEINSLEDIKGLKMRIPGIGGEVLKEAGGIPVTLPGGELFTALQTGSNRCNRMGRAIQRPHIWISSSSKILLLPRLARARTNVRTID